jgi:hypothetical protein
MNKSNQPGRKLPKPEKVRTTVVEVKNAHRDAVVIQQGSNLPVDRRK